MRATTRIGLILAGCAAVVLGMSLRTTTAQATAGDGRGEIATVDVIVLIEDMMKTAEYAEPRSAMETLMRQELTEAGEQLTNLEAEIRVMDQADPSFALKVSEYQSLAQNLDNMTQAKAAEYDQSNARQAVAIYGRVTDAADTVAQRMGYRYVIASRAPDAPMEPELGFNAMAQQVLSRPMIFGAENDDITAAVRAELGMPEPSDDADSAEENAGG